MHVMSDGCVGKGVFLIVQVASVIVIQWSVRVDQTTLGFGMYCNPVDEVTWSFFSYLQRMPVP